jgi:hypothetical protein
LDSYGRLKLKEIIYGLLSTEDFVDAHQLLKDDNIEGNQDKEGWLMFNAGKENDEESVEILEEIPNELEDLWHELSLLENRLAK